MTDADAETLAHDDYLMRPRRSVLYMPASNAKALEKAKTLAADALIFDLEDAVAPDAKDEARAQALKACQEAHEGAYGDREIILRVNHLTTPWGKDDIAAAAQAQPHAVLYPKPYAPGDIEAVDQWLAAQGFGGALWAMMETPLALLNARDLAATAETTRLRAFVMGTNDIAKECAIKTGGGRAAMMTALQLSVLAAKAYDLAVIDGVYNDLQDAEGFEAECLQGEALGFDGKTLIHPAQIETANRVFAPDPAALDWARKIRDVFEEPANTGAGVVKVEGKMVERLHAEQAKRLCAKADAIAAKETGA